VILGERAYGSGRRGNGSRVSQMAGARTTELSGASAQIWRGSDRFSGFLYEMLSAVKPSSGSIGGRVHRYAVGGKRCRVFLWATRLMRDPILVFGLKCSDWTVPF
jgi:hypothetical protein